MPRAPVPSATGEHPCPAERSRTPLFPELCAVPQTPSVTPGLLWRLLLAWFPPSLSLAGRSVPVIRSIRCISGTRTNWDGRQCPDRRYGSSPGCASTSWRYRRRRDSRRCGIWRPFLRWHCRGTGCGCWWPRGARRNCRGCSTGWSGALSRWISRRSARTEASRLPRRRIPASRWRRSAGPWSRNGIVEPPPWRRTSGLRCHRVPVLRGRPDSGTCPRTGPKATREPVPRTGSRPVRKRRGAREGPPAGCDPRSPAARWNRRCRRCRRWAAGASAGALGAPPISYDWCRRWPHNATG
jgi:hypothetical protein